MADLEALLKKAQEKEEKKAKTFPRGRRPYNIHLGPAQTTAADVGSPPIGEKKLRQERTEDTPLKAGASEHVTPATIATANIGRTDNENPRVAAEAPATPTNTGKPSALKHSHANVQSVPSTKNAPIPPDFNMVQRRSVEPVPTASKPVQYSSTETVFRVQKQVEPSSEPGSEPGSERSSRNTGFRSLKDHLPRGEMAVLRTIAQLESRPGEPVFLRNLQIETASGLSREGVRTAKTRLRKRKFIELVGFRSGPYQGGSAFILLDAGRELLAKAASSNFSTILVQNPVQNRIHSSISSSSLDLNTTNYSDPGFSEIDCSPLTRIGFSHHQVNQVARAKVLTPEQLQESINGFAFDLEHNDKAKAIKGDHLAYIMGILKKGPYTMPVNYESDQDRRMRAYAENSEKRRQAKAEMEEKILRGEFEDWLDGLSPALEKQLLPPSHVSSKPGAPGRRSFLLEHFREHVWPGIRQSILSGQGN